MDLLEKLSEYETAALGALTAATDAQQLEAVRVEFLGKKHGRLKDLQSLMGSLSAEERPTFGKRFNEIKERVELALKSRQEELNRPKSSAPAFDVTLPGIRPKAGRVHPLTQTMLEFKQIMARFGFSAVEGPEIEDEFHNFEALNIPQDHPARDPLDNFYLQCAKTASGSSCLLRSQTSTVQIRVMEKTPPPIRIVSLGRVYRPDDIDATHHCMFHQMEGLMVDTYVTMAHLKTVLRLFAETYLGGEVKIRFRPSFFPFTEPSVEVDMYWRGRWMEIGGAGMVDPNVLRAVGYDPEQVTGFAFGLGIERFAMRRYGVTDIRRFLENDIRFLRQF